MNFAYTVLIIHHFLFLLLYIFYIYIFCLDGEVDPFKDTVLIVDEVDDLIVDANPNQPYNVSDADKIQYLEACKWFHENE